MEIERFYLGCLAHASYFVHDEGEAAVIDPQRDVDLYIDEARKRGVEIRWVIETHLHADFVSGHLELGRRTGATICLGAGSGAVFEHRELDDGEELALGGGTLRILSTPGHTEESISIVAIPRDRPAEPLCVFTGDTLFIGDVGRPDLSPTRTPQELAALLFDSLHGKLLRLPDDTVVYPAHGAGSLCGRQMSSEAASTIGKERRTNYALQAATRERFVDLLTGDLPARPAYFHDEVERNRSGAAALEQLAPLGELSPSEVSELQSAGAIVLDTRPVMQFAGAHVPGSIHVALTGQFASWAARILAADSEGVGVQVVLVAEDEAAVRESRLRLARVGIENVAGYLGEGIFSWIRAGKSIHSVAQISAQELALVNENPVGTTLLDVRERSERSGGFIPGSVSIPLPELRKRLGEIDRDTMVFVHCKGGYRSSIATSILLQAGFPRVGNVTGGYDAWTHMTA
jgi:glyoxylase-like metal-dependent hydrolase (beta-lactamase superfamily II)